MAYVGEMQYLTIGSNTYSLPSSGGSGTVTSVGVSNDTNGGLSISGSPVTSSGTITIGHSNVLTSAQSTQAVYPITIDKNGHIASYGNAVTIPSEELGIVALYDDTYSDVSTAYDNYKYIIGYDGEGPAYFPLEKIEGGFTFTGIHKNGSDLFATEYTISSSGVWSNSSIRVDYMKWAASSSTNTYYPLVSSSASNTFTASTLNGINFYQYYNTAGGYRRLELGNATAYKSTGGAYGTIRLYGAAATYYGDLVPGTLGTTSGDGHISANRTWTLPDATGTIALTSDIPTVPTITLNGSSTTSPSFYAPTGAGTNGYVLKSNGSGAPSWTSATLTDNKVSTSAVTSGTTYYPTLGSDTTSAETKYYDATGFKYHVTTGTSSSIGYSALTLGNHIASGTAGNKIGEIDIYSSSTHFISLTAADSLASDREIALPDKNGTIALTSDIPADEKLKVERCSNNTYYSIVCMPSNGTIPRTTSGNLTGELAIKIDGSTSSTFIIGDDYRGEIALRYSSGGSYCDTKIVSSHTTTGRTITLPDATGTVALTSDIPTTASDVGAVPTSDITTSGEANKIPKISSGGVLEVRKYIDMHDTSSTLDYDVRLSATTSGTAGTGTLGITAEEMQISISSSSTLYTDIVALGWTDDVIMT